MDILFIGNTEKPDVKETCDEMTALLKRIHLEVVRYHDEINVMPTKLEDAEKVVSDREEAARNGASPSFSMIVIGIESVANPAAVSVRQEELIRELVVRKLRGQERRHAEKPPIFIAVPKSMERDPLTTSTVDELMGYRNVFSGLARTAGGGRIGDEKAMREALEEAISQDNAEGGFRPKGSRGLGNGDNGPPVV